MSACRLFDRLLVGWCFGDHPDDGPDDGLNDGPGNGPGSLIPGNNRLGNYVHAVGGCLLPTAALKGRLQDFTARLIKTVVRFPGTAAPVRFE